MLGYSKERTIQRQPHPLFASIGFFANCLNVYPKAIPLNKASSRIINEHNMQNKFWLTNLVFLGGGGPSGPRLCWSSTQRPHGVAGVRS